MPIDGTYKIELDTPLGKQAARLTLKTAGAVCSGHAEAELGQTDFTGTIKGDDLAWRMEINSPLGRMKLDCKGKVTGSDISGEVKAGAFGSFAFKGKKT
jgi:hypothetical protein